MLRRLALAVTLAIAAQTAADAGPLGGKGPLGGAAVPPLQFYLQGFQPSAGGNSTSVSLAAGTADDSTHAVSINRISACPVDLGTAGAGGLDTGSLAANTWYALYVIQGTAGTNCLGHATTAAGVPAAGSLTLPAGYTYARYVARVKTNAGAATVNATTILPAGQFYVDASDSYTVCSGLGACKQVRFLACGGGASGGSGGLQTSATAVSGGSGGSGGGCMDETYAASQLTSPVSATIGAGGSLVNGPTSGANTAGTAGNDGNPSFFGASAAAAYVYGGKGCAGSGGQLNAASASGGDGVGWVNTASGAALCTDGSGSSNGNAMVGGINGTIGTAGTANGTPGAAGVGGSSAAIPIQASGGSGTNRFSCGGGGAGGGVTSAPGSINGGLGGRAMDSGVASGAGSTSSGSAGGAGVAPVAPWLPGSAAGGGFGNSAGNGSDGGAGAQCSGGGGGGSAVPNTGTAGKGGAGGNGYGYIWESRNLRIPANDNEPVELRLAA